MEAGTISRRMKRMNQEMDFLKDCISTMIDVLKETFLQEEYVFSASLNLTDDCLGSFCHDIYRQN